MIVNDNNQAALSILSLVSLKSCIYRAGQCEEVSHHCCLVTAAQQVHLTSHKPSPGLFLTNARVNITQQTVLAVKLCGN